MQTRLESLVESFTNIAIGYVVAILSQLLIFPFYDIRVPLSSNLIITLWFTVISVIRSYVCRRWFNRKALAKFKKHNAEIKGTPES